MISSKTNESGSPAAAGAGEDPSPPPGGSEQQALLRPGVRWQGGERWRLALWILVCLEVGLFLLLVPWSPLWTRNLWVGYYPALRPLYMNSYVRGAISGLGLINLWFGFRQVWDFRLPPKAGESDG